MPSRYNTTNPDRKISQGPASKPSGPGKSGTVNVRQSYTGMPLPGKASHAFAEAKKGYREVNGYAAYKGLSQSGEDGQGIYRAPKDAAKLATPYASDKEESAYQKAKEESSRTGKPIWQQGFNVRGDWGSRYRAEQDVEMERSSKPKRK